MGDRHNFFAGTSTRSDGLENFGFGLRITEEISLFKFFVMFGVIFREKILEKVSRLGVRKGALFDEFITALGVRIRDIARDSIDGFTLRKSVGSGI